MMRTRREWNRMIDAHVQGLNDPNAPFNQPDYSDNPICNKCEKDDCDDICSDLEKYWLKQNIEEEKVTEQMHKDWLESQEYKEEEEDAEL